MTRAARRRLLVAAGAAPFLALAGAHAQSVRRAVSVGGAVTEIVYAVGAGSTLVGADSTSTFPAPAEKLPRVGYMRQLSAEGVLALKPDLLVATAEAGPPAVLTQIESTGVAVKRLAVRHSVESLRENVREVAGLFGAVEGGRRVIAEIDAQWGKARARVAAATGRPRVLFVLAHGGGAPMAAGDGTAAESMIAYAGGVNAVQGMQGYKPLTAEAALAAAPDFILITQQGLDEAGGIDRLLARPGLALTPAGRARRVVAMDALVLLGFGPRMPSAVLDLATRLHG